MRKIFKLISSLIICEGAGVIGSLFTVPEIPGWYSTLNKPGFTPPGYIIGAIWTVLFFLMGVSLYLVWVRNWEVKSPGRKWAHKAWNRFSEKLLNGSWRRENVMMIFAAQLVLNVLWSAVFFGLKFPGLAFFELLMLWVAILYTIVNFYRISKLAGLLLVPYILWVTFAGYLNFVIWQIN